jgi:hypothetical protein
VSPADACHSLLKKLEEQIAHDAAEIKAHERGQPYGDGVWVRATAARLGLESTLRPRGRPKKEDQP